MIEPIKNLTKKMRPWRSGLMKAGRIFGVCFFGVVFSLSSVLAQDTHEKDGKALAQKALEEIQHNMVLSKEREAELLQEVDSLKKDQYSLTQTLIESAKEERRLSQEVQHRQDRLGDLLIKKRDVEKQLARRRAEFSQVLAAIERLGLNPPPAILVHPDDALQAVRSAALLGAVVPDMRGRMDALRVTLSELEAVEVSIHGETTELEAAVRAQNQEKRRLQLLLSEKARLQKQSEDNLVNERLRTAELSQKAQSVQDLVTELERQSDIQLGNGSIRQQEPSPFLSLRVEFNRLKGRLALPVLGKLVTAFDKNTQGETYETEAGAVVLSPAEGIVRYAGNFRSYGQMLIIDVGQNYHIILAGLGTLDVMQCQVVLQGEPVGSMGKQLIASAATLDIGKTAPMLYIEIRKEGKPVDPESWWVRGQAGKGQG